MDKPQENANIASWLKECFHKLSSLDEPQRNEFWQRFKKYKHMLPKKEQEKIAIAFCASDEDYQHLLSVVSEVLAGEDIDCLTNAQQKLDALSESERKLKSIEILKKL
ncbi:MAG TPA: hypothetical protein DCS93_04435 [Microscillaceae bacterium]|nr:hypothetical protein [Microscillaceae bacterium]